MNYVVMSIAFGMFGLFLPLTIFLQSVLGLTALQAGLTTAPMSLISMFVAPVAGRLADRIGGKWILFVGLSLFSAGMGILIASSHLGVTRWHLLPGLIVAGFGMGMTFAPLQTVAMMNVQPRMAGAASGVINTTRQLGGVLGFAAVGALLQAQLSAKLSAAAEQLSATLPQPQRSVFLAKFHDVATGNLDIGSTASGGTAGRDTLAAHVFGEGFVNAMRVTLWLPIVVLAVGALAVLLVKGRTWRTATPAAPDAEADKVPVG